MTNQTALPLLAFVVVAAFGASAPQSAPLRLAKECSHFHGKAGDHCTLTRSNVSRIPVGSRVYYLAAADLKKGTYDGDVELRVNRGNVARGHCVVTDLFSKTPNAVVGKCNFAGGTGRFKTFSADVAVSVDAKHKSWYDWKGTAGF
jgi:hypothetical protein